MATQQRVDEIVQQVKASGGVNRDASGSAPRLQSGKLTALELTRLTMSLESLAEDLAADPGVIMRHMAKLQTLDLAAQALRKIAAGR